MNLKFIKIDVENNTIEAQWFENVLDDQGVVIGSVSCRCVNYSEGNRAEFLADVPNAMNYIQLLGW